MLRNKAASIIASAIFFLSVFYIATANGEDAMIVELDIFSGATNPNWPLTPEETKQFNVLLMRLPEQTGAQPLLFDGLGYRGFRVAAPSQSRKYIIQGHVVVVEEANKKRYLSDEKQQVERCLIRIAKKHLQPDLYAFLRLISDQ